MRRIFLTQPECTTAEAAEWAYVRRGIPNYSMTYLRRVLSRYAERVGYRSPGGIIWRRKEPYEKLVERSGAKSSTRRSFKRRKRANQTLV